MLNIQDTVHQGISPLGRDNVNNYAGTAQTISVLPQKVPQGCEVKWKRKELLRILPRMRKYHLKIKIQLGEVPILMRERCKILNGIYYDLLQHKYDDKIGNIGRENKAGRR